RSSAVTITWARVPMTSTTCSAAATARAAAAATGAGVEAARPVAGLGGRPPGVRVEPVVVRSEPAGVSAGGVVAGGRVLRALRAAGVRNGRRRFRRVRAGVRDRDAGGEGDQRADGGTGGDGATAVHPPAARRGHDCVIAGERDGPTRRAERATWVGRGVEH